MPAEAKAITEIVKSLKGPIVVFGAGGFMGSNLLRRLASERDDCFGVTHQVFVPWRLIGLPNNNILFGDVTNVADMSRLFSQYNFKTIFCLHAYGGFARQNNPETIYNTNFMGLLNIINAASLRGFDALVHAGSQSEYGTNCTAPLEDAFLEPNSHYAVSKVSASYLLSYMAQVKQLPVINLRYYSIFGPYEESDRLIAKVVQEGMAKRYPPFVDPNISRDFVYIDDAIEATLLAATLGVSKLPGGSLNIASGKKTTIRDVALAAKEVFGIEQEPVWGSMQNRFWDLKDWWGNPAKAQSILGWKASTSFKEGLILTRNWYQVQRQLPEIASMIKLQAPPRLSAVIACYQDALAIPVMYQRLTEAFNSIKVDYEIIFVNDASPDHSAEVLAKIAASDSRVLVIEHSRNFGSQNAFISGMGLATGDAIILLDGDLQDPPELIPQFFRRWREGYEVVYGRRVKRIASPMMRFCYKAFYRLLRLISYVPIPLDAGDFSLMDRKVVNELLALPETDQFLRGLRAWVGFKQIGVDYVRPERMFGTSTNNWRRNLAWARKAVFSFSFVPLEFMLYFGVLLTSLSFLALGLQIAAKLMNADIPHGITTLIVLALFFGGIQVMGMAFLGEYLAKIFEEAKRRPKYIRRSVTVGGQRVSEAHDMEQLVKSRQEAA